MGNGESMSTEAFEEYHDADGTDCSSTLPISNSASELKEKHQLLPTVFKWGGGGNEVYISGSFTNWKSVQMVRNRGFFFAIVDLSDGEHQYKFIVDGQWMHDPSKPNVDNEHGSKNNIINVKKEDLEELEDTSRAVTSNSSVSSSTSQVNDGLPPGRPNSENAVDFCILQ